MKRFSKKRFLLYIKQAIAFAELPESDFEKRYSTLAEMWCITHKQPFTKNGKQLFEKAFSNNEKLYLALPETIRAAVKDYRAFSLGCMDETTLMQVKEFYATACKTYAFKTLTT